MVPCREHSTFACGCFLTSLRLRLRMAWEPSARDHSWGCGKYRQHTRTERFPLTQKQEQTLERDKGGWSGTNIHISDFQLTTSRHCPLNGFLCNLAVSPSIFAITRDKKLIEDLKILYFSSERRLWCWLLTRSDILKSIAPSCKRYLPPMRNIRTWYLDMVCRKLIDMSITLVAMRRQISQWDSHKNTAFHLFVWGFYLLRLKN